MPIKVAINGYGRIGRNVLRALYETGRRDEMEIVAINQPAEPGINALLTKRDTAHGPFPGEVRTDGDDMIVNGYRNPMFSDRDTTLLTWGELEFDVVHESTGAFTSLEMASAHLKSGARKVLISSTAGKHMPTIVYGVNHDILPADDDNASN